MEFRITGRKYQYVFNIIIMEGGDKPLEKKIRCVYLNIKISISNQKRPNTVLGIIFSYGPMKATARLTHYKVVPPRG